MAAAVAAVHDAGRARLHQRILRGRIVFTLEPGGVDYASKHRRGSTSYSAASRAAPPPWIEKGIIAGANTLARKTLFDADYGRLLEAV